MERGTKEDAALDGTIWKDLLNRLGCLENGCFVAPKKIGEVFITVKSIGGHRTIMLDRHKPAPEGWTYTDDFIVYNDGKGHTFYHAWYSVDSVNTIEA